MSDLGTFLKDRRARLDPAALGLPTARRRTPGLRREEVAQRAHVSATWYTWLEQGRGGAPSADVLNRIARALMLTEAEREHLFRIGLGRPPDIAWRETEGVTPRLQRVLDALEFSPALVHTQLWDIVAWNRAAAAVLTDYGELPPGERNILRLIFTRPEARHAKEHWQSVARFVVSGFRATVAGALTLPAVRSFVDEMCRISPDFDALWRSNEVAFHNEGTKQIRHPKAGLITMDFSSFTVDGRPDLSMVVYNPETAKDAARIRKLIAAKDGKATSVRRR
jgi:transcriptional regulator with XRE-family HTH domain